MNMFKMRYKMLMIVLICLIIILSVINHNNATHKFNKFLFAISKKDYLQVEHYLQNGINVNIWPVFKYSFDARSYTPS